MTIINLTPHPVRVFAADTPDKVDESQGLESITISLLAKTYVPVRLAEIYLGTVPIEGLPVVNVAYGQLTANPPKEEDTYYVVSLATALAMRDRKDFLVPYREVRNELGTVIGCRALAKPC